MDPVINFGNPIVEATNYNTWVIEHYDSQQIDTFNTSTSPQKGIICVPTSEATMTGIITTAINAFLASGNNYAAVGTT